jgi:hypothetical protein
MKNEIRKIDNNKGKDLGRKTHANVMKMTSRVEFMLPKRRFWKPEKHFGPPVWALFQGCEYSFWATLA